MAPTPMTAPLTRWIIFDGDNTLWDVEALYDEARTALCRLLAEGTTTVEEIERFQRARDHALHREMGYARERFPLSFTQTALHFLAAGDDRLEEAHRLANRVFERAAAPMEDVDDVLALLSAKSFRFALLTAGAHEVQQRRLEQFGRTHYFGATRIVERKEVATIAAFVADLGAVPASTWMVGDSLKSDIVPAIAAGLNAIHLDVANWYEVEAAGSTRPDCARVARTLKEAAEIILREAV